MVSSCPPRMHRASNTMLCATGLRTYPTSTTKLYVVNHYTIVSMMHVRIDREKGLGMGLVLLQSRGQRFLLAS